MLPTTAKRFVDNSSSIYSSNDIISTAGTRASQQQQIASSLRCVVACGAGRRIGAREWDMREICMCGFENHHHMHVIMANAWGGLILHKIVATQNRMHHLSQTAWCLGTISVATSRCRFMARLLRPRGNAPDDLPLTPVETLGGTQLQSVPNPKGFPDPDRSTSAQHACRLSCCAQDRSGNPH